MKSISSIIKHGLEDGFNPDFLMANAQKFANLPHEDNALPMELSTLLHGLCEAILTLDVSIGDFTTFINDLKTNLVEDLPELIENQLDFEIGDDEIKVLMASDQSSPFASTLTDILCNLDLETSLEPREGQDVDKVKEKRQKFLDLVKGLHETIIPKALLQIRLDQDILQELDMLPPATAKNISFSKRMIRSRTALFYKQQKFNLLREESEGWARIVVEFGSNCVSMEELVNRFEGANQQDLDNLFDLRVDMILRNVRSLVGYFDLDPNRVLDVLIDVFAANVRDYHDFFLRLLERSPWCRKRAWVGTFEPRQDAMQMEDEDGDDEEQEWDEGPQPIPLLAQILGFKFRFYTAQLKNSKGDSVTGGIGPFTDNLWPTNTSLSKSAQEGVPPLELQLVAALLIRRGLVRIEDLWVHLGNGTDVDKGEGQDLIDMETEYATWQKAMDKRTREAGKSNALAMAAPLGDDSHPTPIVTTSESKTQTTSKNILAPKPFHQKMALCAALLSVGAYHEALWILDRLPRIGYLNVEIPPLLCRVFHHMIEPVYSSLRPNLRPDPVPENFISSRTIYWREITEPRHVAKRIVGRYYKWFYDDWNVGLHQWSTYDNMLAQLTGLLRYITMQGLAEDIKFWTKVVRVATAHVKQLQVPMGDATSLPQIRAWLSIASHYLLPALSLHNANPGAAQELWNLLQLFPWRIRYEMYRDWRKKFDDLPELRLARAVTIAETKAFMRRISKDTVKQYGRMLGKIVHGNPTVSFPVVLSQIEAYDNLIQPIIECSRYLTDLGFDVLGWALLERLEQDRPRVKEDGMNVAQWLSNIAVFTGAALKRHLGIESAGLIRFVFNRIKRDEVFDLTILSELLSNMAGVQVNEGIADAQLEALGGGQTLKRAVLYTSDVSAASKSSVKLKQTLLENSLVAPFAIVLGRLRGKIVFIDVADHMKMVAGMFDQIQNSLIQYTEFLMENFEPVEYSDFMPLPQDLVSTYGVEPEVAWFLARPKLRHLMKLSPRPRKERIVIEEVESESEEEKVEVKVEEVKEGEVKESKSKDGEVKESESKDGEAKEGEVKEGEYKDGDVQKEAKEGQPEGQTEGEAQTNIQVEMETDEPKSPERKKLEIETEIQTPFDIQSPVLPTPMLDGLAMEVDSPLLPKIVKPPADPNHPLLNLEVATIEDKSDPTVWHPGLIPVIKASCKMISPKSIDWISPHFYTTFWQLGLYDIWIPKSRYEAAIAKEKQTVAELEAQSKDSTVEFSRTKKRTMERSLALIEKLKQEQKEQEENLIDVMDRLLDEKDAWFSGLPPNTNRLKAIAHCITQDCLYPRARFSPADAMYAAKMVYLMHSLGTVNVATLMVLDRIFSDLAWAICSCTEQEARNFGRFLHELFSVAYGWASSEKTFEKEALGKKKSKSKPLPGLRLKSLTWTAENVPTDTISWKDWRTVVQKWSQTMRRAVVVCLESGDYMRTRNCILILDALLPIYPFFSIVGEEFDKVLTKVIEQEEELNRSDLKLLAVNYQGKLRKRKSEWVPMTGWAQNLPPPKKEEVKEDEKREEKKEEKEIKVEAKKLEPKKPEKRPEAPLPPKPSLAPSRGETRARSSDRDRREDRDRKDDRDRRDDRDKDRDRRDDKDRHDRRDDRDKDRRDDRRDKRDEKDRRDDRDRDRDKRDDKDRRDDRKRDPGTPASRRDPSPRRTARIVDDRDRRDDRSRYDSRKRREDDSREKRRHDDYPQDSKRRRVG